MDVKNLKKQVFDANLQLVKYNLVILTWGNVSAIDRETGIIAIKPRGIEYDLLKSDDMSLVTLDGKSYGKNKYLPSVDLDIHLELYRNFSGVNAIAHTHSAYATAFCQNLEPIPVYGTTHADHFYGSIPCTRMLTEAETSSDYETNIGKSIIEKFTTIDPMQVSAVLTAGHGPFTWGESVRACVEHSLILEELAKMAYLTKTLSAAPHVLPQHMIDKHYLRKYGKDAYFYQTK